MSWHTQWSGKAEAFPGFQGLIQDFDSFEDRVKEHIDDIEQLVVAYLAKHDGKNASILVNGHSTPDGEQSATLTVAAIPRPPVEPVPAAVEPAPVEPAAPVEAVVPPATPAEPTPPAPVEPTPAPAVLPTQPVVPSESAGTQTAAGSPSEQAGAPGATPTPDVAPVAV